MLAVWEVLYPSLVVECGRISWQPVSDGIGNDLEG